MQNLDFVSDLHKMSRILPTPLVFITGYETQKTFSIAYIEHSCRPISVWEIAQLW